MTNRRHTVAASGRAARVLAVASVSVAAAALGVIAVGTPADRADDTVVQDAAGSRWYSHRDGGSASRFHRAAPGTTASSGTWSSSAPSSSVAPAPAPAPSSAAPSSSATAPAPKPQAPAPAPSVKSSAAAAPKPQAPAPAPAPAPAAKPAAPAATSSGGTTAAPQGAPAGWRQVFTDDFTGSSLDSTWRKYSGQPGGSPYGRWDPSHVQLSNGELVLSQTNQGGEWVAGGLANRTALTYGKVEMRMRVDAGDEMKYAALLWPADDTWPPEIDFAEDAGGNRSGTTASLHYGSNNTTIGTQTKADFTQWHTVGVEWTPGRVVYTLDGQAWGQTDNANVPRTPMELAIQVQPGGCQEGGGRFGCGVGNPSVTALHVDWVKLYAQG
ncbi:glycoside hydrolase family 16 protein [Modestobacter sp. NPDC049651]|uniref:glycoside hydrolase family 16 protein n=1 Tax=unclassified Modestobacter TaxID=2643866 RepID=UPI0033C026F8